MWNEIVGLPSENQIQKNFYKIVRSWLTCKLVRTGPACNQTFNQQMVDHRPVSWNYNWCSETWKARRFQRMTNQNYLAFYDLPLSSFLTSDCSTSDWRSGAYLKGLTFPRDSRRSIKKKKKFRFQSLCLKNRPPAPLQLGFSSQDWRRLAQILPTLYKSGKRVNATTKKLEKRIM
jgi:hypothetical protein